MCAWDLDLSLERKGQRYCVPAKIAVVTIRYAPMRSTGIVSSMPLKGTSKVFV